ncbi:MAG: phytoene/squalene synthase family protein [Balneolaceae bacterium]
MKETDTSLHIAEPDKRKKNIRGRKLTSLSANGTDKKLRNLSDFELQQHLLDGVSRTFALTIPQLPDELHYTVSNAYLLCRIVDTIEDEPELSSADKKHFCDFFNNVVADYKNAEKFAAEMSAVLSRNTSPAEHELIALTGHVVQITHRFSKPQRKALERCVKIMSEGMIYFQENSSPEGLSDIKEMDKYCYHVAGVVGEMLTELFCLHSPEIAKNKDKLMNLSVSFGQGLQMTNILKDLWEDAEVSACWLPKSVFDERGFSLNNLKKKQSTEEFQDGIKFLIGITNSHLERALEYTLLIPAEEKGIRQFCLWAIGMAVLTIRKIYKNIDYTEGSRVKISRNSVKSTILFTNMAVKNDFLLKTFFNIARAGLPYQKA